MPSLSNALTYAQQPVADHECERLVIGTLVQNGTALDEVGDILTEECFDDGRLKAIFSAIKALTDAGQQADIITIPPYLEKHFDQFRLPVTELIQLTSGAIYAGLREKCLYLDELARRRRLLFCGLKLVTAGTTQAEEYTQVVQELLDTVDHINDSPVSDITTTHDALQELRQAIDRNQQEGGAAHDYSGIRCFDERAFLHPEALTVIAAYSGHGKSCLATTIAYNCAQQGSPVAYYSLEMSKQELVARTIAHVCKVPTARLLYGKMGRDELRDFDIAAIGLDTMPIYFDERATVSSDALYQSIRQMARRKKIRGVVIDYLQILSQNGRPKNQTEEAFLGGVVRQLKNLAKQLGIWVILLSQISRNHDSEEPKESYLRGSGQILEGCDNCVLLYRPSKHEGARYSGSHINISPQGTAELNVCKARNGADGRRYIIGFQPEYTYFEELSTLPRLDVGI